MNVAVSQLPHPASLPETHLLSIAAPHPGERLHDRFVRQAALTPDAPAVIHAGQCLSYRELDERSDRIAHLLHANHVRPGALVGICLERGIDLVASLIAVLKAGAGYVPLDPAYPRDRLTYMLADSGAGLLIASRNDLAFDGTVIALGDAALETMPATPLATDRDEAALACVIYTSGSTGRPKGVMLRHTATAFIRWAERTFTQGELARVAATTSICFDPSIFEIFAPLSLGGTVILKRDLLEPFAADEQPTLLNGVPSAFAELVRDNRIPASVRVINIGGERLSASLARAIHHQAGDIQVWNHYGPTETTICASVTLVPPGSEEDPPIGQPIAGARFYILDEAGRPVSPGASGELHIGGSSVAEGYLNLPELTAERFLPDPFRPGERMYRTGDIVRADKAGDLFFIGRQGRQIKFRGFRIELDDIEAVLERIPGLDAAVILTTRGPDGQVNGLRAVIASAAAWSLPGLRRALRDVLPRHMLPNTLVVLPALPLTPSGKIDRQTLEGLEPPAPAPLLQPDPWLPPQTEAILTVFRTMLAQPALGPQDDFFDHGGDSLLAMQTMMQLETLLGHPVAGDLFAEASSAGSLAGALLQQQSWASSPDQDEQAILLQPDGAGAPLFCLTGSPDRPLQALALAQHFRGERPVWALMPPRSGGPGDLFTAISNQLATIRARRPDEPILLLAEGAAAQAATIIAWQLEARGETVVLVLVEPTPRTAPPSRWQRLRDAFRPPGRGQGGGQGRGQGREQGREAARATVRGRTIMVEATSPAEPASPPHSMPRNIERIALSSAPADLLREPAVSRLADALRNHLPSSSGPPAAHHATTDCLNPTGNAR